jgi:hypothetical protein
MEDNFLNKNSYLSFDATSLRDLLVDRLNRGKVFTDQNYQGSNLSSLLDVVGFTFSTLMYYLNKTASESMFSESQIYENMNRIVKILNYNPVGRLGQTVPYKVTATSIIKSGNYTIPRYSYVNVGGVFYSINQDTTFTKSTDDDETIDAIANTYLAYQGLYDEYPLYTASGIDNEIIFMSLEEDIYVDHFNIDVYVKRFGTNKWIKWTRCSELFLYSSDDTVYEVRFNQNKKYEIKFGDDINGKKLDQNDEVSIFYLRVSDKVSGIGPNVLGDSSLISYNSIRYVNILTDTSTTYENFLTPYQLNYIKLNNDYPSTVFTPEETVDSIRNNAPKTFRSQYRLITSNDYESFLKSNYSLFLSDLKVVNNENYTANYIKYLYDLGLSEPQKDNRILFNQIKFASSCNFNNIYIYMVPKNELQQYITPPQKEIILNGLQETKTLTSKIVPMDPVYIYVDFYIEKVDEYPIIDNINLSKLLITKSSNSRRSDSSIKSDIDKIFKKYFSREVNKLGQLIDIFQISTDLLNIDSVERVQTYRSDIDTYLEGISFIFWNSTYPEADAKVFSQNIQLENFKYPIFNNIQNLFSRIEIVEKNMFIKAADF